MQSQQIRPRPADAFGTPALATLACESARENRDGLYPSHVLGGWRDANGLIVQIRPTAASDVELICEFVRALSFETRYLRFMVALNELSQQTIDRLTRIDHRRDAALIATVKDGVADRGVGVARYALNADEQSCDFAIVVTDEWQRRGLGRRLMTLLVDTATARGLNRIDGDVLAINRPMLAFVKSLGFQMSASNDPVVQSVRLVLDRCPETAAAAFTRHRVAG